MKLKTIKPSKVKGTVIAPSSKSMMQRAVAACYLTGANCSIVNPSNCDDALVAMGIVKTLGFDIKEDRNVLKLFPSKSQKGSNSIVLNCGESGLCLRMFSAIVALMDRKVLIEGTGSLSKRPVSMIEGPLRYLGAMCETRGGFLPLTINGPIKAGRITIDASLTSQFLTGLLMALPLCEGESEIIVKDLKSKPYVEMTLKLLEDFGIKVENDNFESFKIKGPQSYEPIDYSVEGDWSGASFLLVAGATSDMGLRVENLNFKSTLQADKAIVDVLNLCGADVEVGDDYVKVKSKKELKAFEFDASDCPDLFPPLTALACMCDGRSIIHGVERLKHKESDRGLALFYEFTKMGASVKLFNDRMEVTGKKLDGAVVDSHDDHRIAMACAISGLNSTNGVSIRGWECVSKSYPEFFKDLEKIGG